MVYIAANCLSGYSKSSPASSRMGNAGRYNAG